MVTNRDKKGTCKWFNRSKGVGFVTSTDNGAVTDYFVHYSAIQLSEDGFRFLTLDQEITFDIEDDPRAAGKQHAVNVRGSDGKPLPPPPPRQPKPPTPAAPKEDEGEKKASKKPKKSRKKKSKAKSGENTDAAPTTTTTTSEEKPKKKTKPRRRPASARAAHWVIRCSDLQPALKFFSEVFGMKVLRHEEHKEACEITCNGRYNGAWSKTMVGFETEDKSYCIEVTYNYGVHSYKKSTGLAHIAIAAEDMSKAVAKAKEMGYKTQGNLITGPDGYDYLVVEKVRREMFDHVKIRVGDVEKAKAFYTDVVGMVDLTDSFKVDSASTTAHAVVGFTRGGVPVFLAKDATKPKLDNFDGRLALAIPNKKLNAAAEKLPKECVLHELRVLKDALGDLPIVIAKDPTGYEVALIGAEVFGKAALAATDYVGPVWEERRAFIDASAGKKNKGKSS